MIIGVSHSIDSIGNVPYPATSSTHTDRQESANISANSSLCLFLQPKYKAKGPMDDANNSLNSTCLISSIHFCGTFIIP